MCRQLIFGLGFTPDRRAPDRSAQAGIVAPHHTSPLAKTAPILPFEERIGRTNNTGMEAGPETNGSATKCFMVAPLPEGWKVFVSRSPVIGIRSGPVERFWLEEVLPAMLTEWGQVSPQIEDILPNLDFAFPRGLAIRTADGTEIRHGGGLTGWMRVTSTCIETALNASNPIRWVQDEEFTCTPSAVAEVRALLGIKERW